MDKKPENEDEGADLLRAMCVVLLIAMGIVACGTMYSVLKRGVGSLWYFFDIFQRVIQW